jgi:hypothetical protein
MPPYMPTRCAGPWVPDARDAAHPMCGTYVKNLRRERAYSVVEAPLASLAGDGGGRADSGRQNRCFDFPMLTEEIAKAEKGDRRPRVRVAEPSLGGRVTAVAPAQKRRKARWGRRCAVCESPHRAEAEEMLLLLCGIPSYEFRRNTGLTEAALKRHHAEHMNEIRRAARAEIEAIIDATPTGSEPRVTLRQARILAVERANILGLQRLYRPHTLAEFFGQPGTLS